ncbi:MAG: DUF3791 domain-containing protein [Candidatus Methanomethylophilaceae archaeon]
MDERMAFAVHCIELYRRAHGMDGNTTVDIFIKTGALDYVMDYYEALHVMGNGYILDDLESFISEHSPEKPLSPLRIV